MNSFKSTVFSLMAAIAFSMTAASFISAQQFILPRPSQWASITQTVGVTDITIKYSRPGVKGRPIFGDAPKSMAERAKGEATLDDQNERQKGEPIVPYGHVWRTGANDATQFIVTDDVLINGQKLAAGTYSLHTIPGKTEWTIVFNGTANQWGSFNYDPAKDTLRIKAKPETVGDNQEWMMFGFDPVADDSTTVNLRWEKVRVPFTVGVDVVATTMAKARAFLATAKSDDMRTRVNVGMYAMEHNLKDEGMKLLSDALRIADESVKTKETYPALATRANILFAMGRNDEGLAAAEKAIAFGKANKANTAGLEKRVADIKAGKN
jgi:hypothetical protein